MTLAVAWNRHDGIHFASDSRISKGDKNSDYGVKVVPVHIKVFEPTRDGEQSFVAFDCVYGMCFAGDFAGASIIRNFLSISLQRLQYIPAFSEVSFLNICRITYKIYSELSAKIKSEIDSESIDFFLSGYCPKNEKIMLAKFYIDYGEDISRFDPKLEVIDYQNSNDPIYYIGSGENEYPLYLDIHFNKPLSTRPLFALKSLIKSNRVASVGGNIQVGAFDNRNEFYMLGVVEETKNEAGLIDKISYFYAGIDMNSDIIDIDEGAFIVMGNYVDPYR
ncbi:MAG: hypothetical protein PHE17_11370 [Thiothrix sp.]|uniref:hypothetical protein n=1 Tax=Thiothrix sp. TaxID=1032 RepID=UPI0026056637|nr:hypothetical protein [Thiothrix sp.]MDD5393607.1 hypothetical protein [Thiothrix sp.]